MPNYGVFVPITKVSKSPSKYKPGNCMIHSGAGQGVMKRANSRDSMNSSLSFTSAASSARRVRLGVNSLTPKVGWFCCSDGDNTSQPIRD